MKKPEKMRYFAIAARVVRYSMGFLRFLWNRFSRFPVQLRSLIAVFSLLLVAFLIIRNILTPPTFGEKGHYRSEAVTANASHPIKYAGSEACLDCHDDVYEKKSASYHNSLACETCHGPAATHTDDPSEHLPYAPRGRRYCVLCHEYNPSRPTGFPQIDPVAHNPLKPCYRCHDPHDPKPPHVPEECSACHRNIARVKAISHHAEIPCSKCHRAPERHNVEPSLYKPTKPSSREFCGQCHDASAESPKEIPRVDLETHNIRYVCWQCHYPHYPEAK